MSLRRTPEGGASQTPEWDQDGVEVVWKWQ